MNINYEDMENLVLKEQSRKFDETVIANLEETTTETDLYAKDLTPNYGAYADDMTKWTPYTPDEDIKPMPKAGDNYVTANDMFCRGGNILS